MWNFFSVSFSLFLSLVLSLSTLSISITRRVLIFWITVWWFWHSFVSQIKAFYGKNVANLIHIRRLTHNSGLASVRYHDPMIIFMLCFPFCLTLFFQLSLSLPLEWIPMKLYAADKRIVAANKLPFRFFPYFVLWFEILTIVSWTH